MKAGHNYLIAGDLSIAGNRVVTLLSPFLARVSRDPCADTNTAKVCLVRSLDRIILAIESGGVLIVIRLWVLFGSLCDLDG